MGKNLSQTLLSLLAVLQPKVKVAIVEIASCMTLDEMSYRFIRRVNDVGRNTNEIKL